MSAIIELLLKIQLIDDRQHDAVMSRSKSGSGGHIVQQVAEMGYATEGAVARAVSVELGLPRIDLQMTPPEAAALALLDARTCAERFVLPVALRENGELLWLAMADPTDQDAISAVRRKSQKRVRPAVAGPSEILRAMRTLYAAPGEVSQPEGVAEARLAAIELADQVEGEAFEVVNVSDESSSPLSRLAAQLGISVPEKIPSRISPRARAPEPAPALEIDLDGDAGSTMMDARPAATQRMIPPNDAPQGLPRPPSSAQAGPLPREGASRSGAGQERRSAPPTPQARPASADDELVAAATTGGGIAKDDLSEDDLATIDALRQSMEKGALVLRALAELCVEKGVFTREEMGSRRR